MNEGNNAPNKEIGRLLIIAPPEAKGYIFIEKKEMIMGRELGSDIQVPDQQSSKNHAKITRDKETYTIQDMGSRNGTFVNDQKLTKLHTLAVGDIIRIGNFKYKFLLCEEEQVDEWKQTIVSMPDEPSEGKLEAIAPTVSKGPIILNKQQMILGRIPECDIQVIDHQVSKNHAKIYRLNDFYVFEDMGSSNGSYVTTENGRENKITKHFLKNGDVIRLGNSKYRFSL